jgi:hypothetical protein
MTGCTPVHGNIQNATAKAWRASSELGALGCQPDKHGSAYGNKLPILPPEHCDDLNCLPLLLANLNSIVCDYVARQKIQSRNLNKYILE